MKPTLAALLALVALWGSACGATEDDPAQRSASLAARALELAAAEPACRALGKQSVPERGSLVLIVSDTMRRDAAGIYGGRARTPHFDAFGRQNLVFRKAVSQAPWTKPAVATLFTSTFPSQHGVADDPQARSEEEGELLLADVLSPDFVTLAEVLKQAGFRTAAFIANPWMEKRFGFAQGFEVYDDSFASFNASGELVSEAAAQWLDGIGSHERFFLYLHYIDAHRPYGALDASEVAAARKQLDADLRDLPNHGGKLADALKMEDGRSIREAGLRLSPSLVQMSYRRGVENFDRALGGFLRALEAHPLHPKTATIVTSDHGEALFDAGYGGHAVSLREEEIAVPMLARLPGIVPETASLDCLAGLVDIMPTVCDYFDIPCPPSAAGHSLLTLANAAPDAAGRYLVSEGVPKRRNHRSIQNRRYKLMGAARRAKKRGSLESATSPGLAEFAQSADSEQSRQSRQSDERGPRIISLYDLSVDPHERNNLIQAPTSESDAVASVLASALLEAVGPPPEVSRASIEIDSEMQERLEAIGYLRE